MTIPYNLSMLIEDRAARTPSNYARLTRYGARIERQRDDAIVFYFEDAPDVAAVIGEARFSPGRYVWALNNGYEQQVEAVIATVRPDLLPEIDDDVPF